MKDEEVFKLRKGKTQGPMQVEQYVEIREEQKFFSIAGVKKYCLRMCFKQNLLLREFSPISSHRTQDISFTKNSYVFMQTGCLSIND